MVLGAAQYQVPLIQAVMDMGHIAYVASINGNYPGIDMADHFLEVDITDCDAVVNAAVEADIHAVCTASTDLTIPALGAVGETLVLPSIHKEQAYLATNKILMKKAFSEHGVPTARFEVAGSLAGARAAANRIGYPIMAKAVDSMGGAGITKVCCESELSDAWHRALEASGEKEVIVEEFMEGVEFGAQAMTAFGALQYAIPHNDTVSPPPYCSPLGHSFPADLPDSIQRETFDVTQKGMLSLGLTHSHGNIDLILTDSGVKVIEIGPRVGATCLPESTSIYTGMDVYRQIVDLALGERPDCRIVASQPNAALFITVDRAGTMKGYEIPPEVERAPDVVRLTMYSRPGDPVSPFRVGRDRVGEVVVVAGTWQGAEKRAREIAKSVGFDIK